VKHHFDGTIEGTHPFGDLMQATNGNLYGMTNVGGANNDGTLFEYDIDTDSLLMLFDFAEDSGTLPRGSLMQASNGKVYGMTTSGGSNNGGTLFEFDITSNLF